MKGILLVEHHKKCSYEIWFLFTTIKGKKYKQGKMFFHPDNAPYHTGSDIVRNFEKLKCKFLSHPNLFSRSETIKLKLFLRKFLSDGIDQTHLYLWPSI